MIRIAWFILCLQQLLQIVDFFDFSLQIKMYKSPLLLRILSHNLLLFMLLINQVMVLLMHLAVIIRYFFSSLLNEWGMPLLLFGAVSDHWFFPA